LARAIAIYPALLLLDEPLSNLDAKLRAEMRGEIIRICRATGVTAVYVTHDQKEALSMADRLAVVRDGRIVQVGRPGEVYRRPASAFVADFIGRTNLLRGKLLTRNETHVTLQVPGAGALVGRAEGQAGGAKAGDPVRCSIRPETIRLQAAGALDALASGSRLNDETKVNRFPAELIETVYLGEIAQHTLRLPDGQSLDAYELHPRFVAVVGKPVRIVCQVDPEDVTILPEETDLV
jgi:iron(III) transport system ATP-binding protein